MLKLHTSLDCLISLTVPKEVSVDRLTKRGQVSARVDDNEAVIRNRLKEYYDKTIPVLQYYKDKGILYEIDGTADIEKVKLEIQKVIKHVLSKKLFNLVLFGYPGSGRSSQGKALAEKFGLEFVTTGEMLHREIENQSGTGKKIEELYAQSLFVPDEIVVQLIEKKLENSKEARGFIIKGFPRTLVQSYILDGLLKKYNSSISMVIEFEVPTLELIQRLDQRSHTNKCKPYDISASKIIQRINLHEKKTLPVIERYDQLHSVTKINGVGSFEEVFQRLSHEVEKGIKHIR
jgi:adenylate kinase